jgi:hypothetical protein
MSPVACRGCPDNPHGKEQKQLDQGALEQHRQDLNRIERLHDAIRMGLLKLADLGDLEFELVRLYWWEVEKQRLQAGVRL